MLKVINDDSLNIPKYVANDSIDLVATDNPYGIAILGKNNWDNTLPDIKIWQNCFNAMKPGAFLLAMCATRTYHRLACHIEDTGFKIKDCLIYGYASGFPRGKNIGKEIERKNGNGSNWEGYNTQLKPSFEMILCAQKPLEGTYAENVMKYGVGGINIDIARIPYANEEDKESLSSFENFESKDFGDEHFFSANKGGKKQVNIHPDGRYPANLMYFDELFPGSYDKFFMVPKPVGAEKYNLTHDTVKPFRLFYRLIQMFSPKPSDVDREVTVLDPFCGTASTGIACKELGRSFIGFELNEHTCKEAQRRLGSVYKLMDIFEK